MNQIGFVVCEYNPFHNGHSYQIKQMRASGVEAVVCIMSGNFTQRGTPAVFHKQLRAEAALQMGADLVLELPLKYAVSGAEEFSKGAIEVIKATKQNGVLSFGCTAGENELLRLAALSRDKAVQNQIASLIREQGVSYAAAFSETVCQNTPELLPCLQDANNILALEYVKQVQEQNCPVAFWPVHRIGNAHNSMQAVGEFASAQYIRNVFLQNESQIAINLISPYVPKECMELYDNAVQNGNYVKDLSRFELLCLSRLAGKRVDELRNISGVNQGLENRLEEGIKQNLSLEALYDYVKSKRFAHSRIRRVVLCSVLGITKQDLRAPLAYIHVLGFNQTGREVLRLIRSEHTVPVVTNISDITGDNINAYREKELDCTAGILYELCKLKPNIPNSEYKFHPIIFR